MRQAPPPDAATRARLALAEAAASPMRDNVASAALAEDKPAHPTRCEHHHAPRESWPWLRTARHGHLEKHPWCSKCGGVAAIGGARARDFGGLVNDVARLCRVLQSAGVKVTEAQRRLITKRLEALDAHDRFTLTREGQERVLLQVVSQYTGIHADTIATYARAS